MEFRNPPTPAPKVMALIGPSMAVIMDAIPANAAVMTGIFSPKKLMALATPRMAPATDTILVAADTSPFRFLSCIRVAMRRSGSLMSGPIPRASCWKMAKPSLAMKAFACLSTLMMGTKSASPKLRRIETELVS
jgi:hypothetical protein